MIPISGENGGTAFVKDSKGQVVKSKLDEKRLREIAEATGGIYLRLENGQGTMKQLISQGLGKMKTGEIDARLARRPIERYEWPLGAALAALAASILITDRKRLRARSSRTATTVFDRRTLAAIGILFSVATAAYATGPGLDSYRQEKFQDAYQQFQETLKEHPRTEASDKIQFDSGAAAYKMKEYGKALESFSQALLSRDTGLQGSSHYNLGNTLYQRGDAQKADDKKLTDWNNALQHYDETLKLNPQNKEAKENRDFVQRKIDELKKKQEQQPTPRRHPRRRNRTRTRRNKTSRRTNKKIRRRSRRIKIKSRIKRIRKINRRTTREAATNKNPRRKRINLKARIAAKIPAPAKIKRNNQSLAKPPPLHLAKVLRLHPERRLLPRRDRAPLLRLRKNQAGIPIKQKSNHHLENPPRRARHRGLANSVAGRRKRIGSWSRRKSDPGAHGVSIEKTDWRSKRCERRDSEQLT